MNPINEKLRELYIQKSKIEEEIKELESKVKVNNNNQLNKNQKIELFKTLFITREDIFAKKWINKDGTKQGFYPVTKTFKSNDFIPITNKDVELHLRGQHQLASYLINKDNQSKYIVFEINEQEKNIWKNILISLSLDSLFEYNSNNSIFIWIFFKELITTKDAKKFASYILKKTNTSAKIYPNKEFVNNSNLGDSIELPLHWKFRNDNKTVFFDVKTNEIYEDQWKILQNIKKVEERDILKYIDFEKVNPNSPAFENIDFPSFKIEIKLYDFLYIPTSNLSKSFINKFKTFASFDNPQIKVLLSLRKPIYNTPRVIKNFEDDDTYLKLPRGLKYKLEEFLLSNKVDYKIENKTFFQMVKTKNVKFNLREEQKAAIEEIVKNDFSICVAPPGYGKTLIGAKMFELRKCSTLVIVNKNMLLNQWIERFVEYFGYLKKDIGYLGKGENKLNGIIDIATMQSLKNSPDVINDYSFVIVDECHHIPAITFEQIVKKFFGKYILGLSATLNRKDGLEPILYEQLGHISYEFKRKRPLIINLKL